MSRSHPPTLLRLVETTLRSECDLPADPRLVLAVSGGPDSMALCDVLGQLRERQGFQLLVCSIDHGLRPEAKDEVALVERFCAARGLPFVARGLGLLDGPNLQERARDARYRALREVARENFGSGALLVTAHHKEDRAETVLLRIVRGTSLEGLAVLPPRSEDVLRPMISASRTDVEAHLLRHSVPSVTDPSNRDVRFTRVRVRQQLLPLLTELGNGAVDHLVELADEAGRLPEPLGLNREQRRQIRRALQDRRNPVNLRLPGGLLLVRKSPGKNPGE